MNLTRKIIHVDMDAFYASVEQRDNPSLRGLPVAVGRNHARGVVAAASYEARKYGVYSALATPKALEKCPTLVLVHPRMEVYKGISQEIREIFFDYTDWVEPLSLDEAFLDVTVNKKSLPSASIIAQEICRRIQEKTQLTASAGVSINKFLAKVASGINKPNGFTLISPNDATEFIKKLPIEKFFGVGKVTVKKMHQLGIQTGEDLLKWSLVDLEATFGKAGRSYYFIVRNQDYRPVTPNRPRHSIGTEDTFDHDLHDQQEMLIRLAEIAREVVRRMQHNQYVGRTLTLKVKFANFKQITRSKTVDHPLLKVEELFAIARNLLHPIAIPRQGVRLLGITVSTECPPDMPRDKQLVLPFPPADLEGFG
ncbi:MAG: DNA polymerase IV [Magnetococcus sp. XQGC-1]